MTDKPIITRELLEHYLRATGWELEPSVGGEPRYGRGRDKIFVSDIDAYCKETFKLDLITEMGVGLGMCAVAEMIYTKMAPRLGNERRVVALVIADTTLTEVGIDPKTWEATR